MANLKRDPAAVEKMPAPLQSMCDEIAILLADGWAQVSKARYRFGLLVLEVDNDKKKYGRGGVKKIARAVGRDEDTLYEYGAVARDWERPEFSKLAARKNAAGVTLAVSHFVAVTGLSKALRNDLLERAFNKRMTVRELRRLVATKVKRPLAANEDDVDVPSRLKRTLKLSDGLLESADGWREWLGQVEKRRGTPEMVTLLESVVSKQHAVAKRCEQYAVALEKQRKRMADEIDSEKGAKKKASK